MRLNQGRHKPTGPDPNDWEWRWTTAIKKRLIEQRWPLCVITNAIGTTRLDAPSYTAADQKVSRAARASLRSGSLNDLFFYTTPAGERGAFVSEVEQPKRLASYTFVPTGTICHLFKESGEQPFVGIGASGKRYIWVTRWRGLPERMRMPEVVNWQPFVR